MLFSAALSIDQTSLALLSLTRKFIRLQADKIKKLFFFFYPHTLTFRLKRPVYRGFSGEGKLKALFEKLCLKYGEGCNYSAPPQHKIVNGTR